MSEKIENWLPDYDEFTEAAHRFFGGEIDAKTYKGISGGYGSYAQRGGKVSMLRFRLPGGRITKEKLAFIADAIDEYAVDKIHFTTCQALQLHNLSEQTVTELAKKALSVGIVTRGGGGDYPRNTMMSPLAGVEKDEYFDVSPYAMAAGDYAMCIIKRKKMPRKLKIAFSNTPKNISHATFRDLGFVAREDGCFDVYCAGGLGNNPRFGVCVAKGIAPREILFYVESMYRIFCAYGNYANRGKARTRYLQEILGGADQLAAEFGKFLAEVKASMPELLLSDEKISEYTKTLVSTEALDQKAARVCAETAPVDRAITAQKQNGLYAVKYHPIGGCPDVQIVRRVLNCIDDYDCAELRICPDESVYVINLSASEAVSLLPVFADGAKTEFEESVACIGASICQQGVRDSQKLLGAIVDMEKKAGFADGVLPQVHISGCPSSCGTHQTGVVGFQGGAKKVGADMVNTFFLHVGGCDLAGREKMGERSYVIPEASIPDFMYELGMEIQSCGMIFADWNEKFPGRILEIAAKYAV